ncbi:hypothetical protein GPALN_004930 [Globodera pallida]|nr:hypothetical protein GPALN_004930 [Globodera pallida]
MASTLLPQCARPLLVVVAALLLCCCRPVEAQWDFNYFNCARTGAKLRGGLTIPMDNQLRINSWQLGRAERDEVAQLGLLMNTKDELKLTMVGGASCSSVFSKANVNGAKCVQGKTTKVSWKHQPEDPPCKDAGDCKAFTLICPIEEDNFSRWSFFRNLVDKRCKWRAYIDKAGLLLYGSERSFGEECPRKTTEDPKKTTTGSTKTTEGLKKTTTGSTKTTEGLKKTTTGSTKTTEGLKKTTTGSTEVTTTNSSDTMTTGSTDPMESTDANITSGWTLIIVVSVVGSIMFIAVVSAVVLVLWHRKQRTSDDAAKVEGEEDEKASSTKTPPKDASSAKSSEKKQTSEDASGPEGEDEASSANTPKKVPSSAVEGVEVPNSLYSKASPDDDDDEGSSVV